MDDIRSDLQVLDDQWHASAQGIVTEWNRLLSKFQPYAHASSLAANETDWLFSEGTYMPFDPKWGEYVLAKYRLA